MHTSELLEEMEVREEQFGKLITQAEWVEKDGKAFPVPPKFSEFDYQIIIDEDVKISEYSEVFYMAKLLNNRIANLSLVIKNYQTIRAFIDEKDTIYIYFSKMGICP